MAKYAFGIYGNPSFKYGQSDADRLYYSSQLTAWAYDYGVISLRWKSVTADPAAVALGEQLTHWRLTKNFSGTPDSAYAGEAIAFDSTGTYLTSYIDTSSDLSDENREVTYTLWIFSSLSGWLNCGTAKVNTIIENKTQTYFKNWLPAAWLNEEDGVGDAVGDYNENEFTAVLDSYGFEYDKIKVQAELLYNSFDAYKVPSNLLKNKITDLGFIYEPALGDTYHRSLYKTGNFVNSAKGTKAGITTYATSLTHWDSDITYGSNLFLDYNDSSFEESIGRWSATNGTLDVCTYANTVSTLGEAIPAVVPDLFNRDYPLRSTSVGVVTASSTSDITLRCPGTSANSILYGIPVTAGVNYVFKGYIRALTNNYTAVAKIQWFDKTGTSISTTASGPTVTASTGFWANFSSISTTVEGGFTAPAGATHAKPTLVITPTATSDKFVLDMFQFRALPATEISPVAKLPGYTYEDARLVKLKINPDISNLIPNSNFVNGIGGWEPFNAEVVHQNFAAGQDGVKLTALSDGRVGFVSDWIQTAPGSPHSFSVFVKGPARTAKSRIEFSAPQTEEEQTAVLTDVDGKFFKKEPYYADSESITLNATTFTKTTVTAVSAVQTPDYGKPVGKVSVYIDSAQLGDVFYITYPILTESSAPKDWFCGSNGITFSDPNVTTYYPTNDLTWERKDQFNMVSLSTFENVTKWTGASGSTVTVQTGGTVKFGTTSMKISASGGGSATTTVKLPMGAAKGGEDIAVSTYVYGPAGLYSLSTNGQKSGNFRLAENTWVRIHTERIAVAGETQFDITVALSEAGTGTKVFYVDGLQAEYGRVPTPYIDPAQATTAVVQNPSDAAETVAVANNYMVGSGRSFYANRYTQKYARLKSTLNKVMPAGSTWSIETPTTSIAFPDVENNLAPSGSFENSTYGWSGVSASLTRTIARGSIFDETLVQGAAYCKVKASSSGTFGAITDYIPVEPGKGYYLSAAVRPENEDAYGTYFLKLKWYDLALNFLREKEHTITLNRNDRWAYLDIVAPGSKTVTLSTIAVASNVVTITTVGNHGFSVGEELYVGINEGAYSSISGNIMITGVTGNTFSYSSTFANTATTEINGRATFANTSVGFAKIEVTCTPSVSGTGRVFHLDKVLFRR